MSSLSLVLPDSILFLFLITKKKIYYNIYLEKRTKRKVQNVIINSIKATKRKIHKRNCKFIIKNNKNMCKRYLNNLSLIGHNCFN